MATERTPIQIKREALADLNATWTKLVSREWMRALEGASAEQRQEAGLLLLDVQDQRMRLRDALLQDIREALVEQDRALQVGSEKLNAALERIEKIANTLKTVNAFLSLVKKVLGLVL